MDTSDTKPKAQRRDCKDVRAERKRELDRLAQRATRERTKNRIAFLEQKLASLESCDQESTIGQLTKTIDDLRKDNMRLQAAMLKMRFAINEALDGTENLAPASNTPQCACGKPNCSCKVIKTQSTTSDTPSADEDVVEMASHNEVHIPVADAVLGMWPSANNTATIEEFLGFQPNSIIPPDFAQPQSNPNLLVSPWPGIIPTPKHSNMSSPSPYNFIHPSPHARLAIAGDVEKWHVSNGALTTAMSAVRNHLATNDTLDLHVPFRAGLWGWDSIPASEQSHPVWSALRAVDQKVFGTWESRAARIAVMYNCQTLLAYRESPTKDNLARVPKYLLPRPSQQRIQHPAVIDYLCWPGLRDRLVFEHEKYTATGEFSAAFVKYAHFDWPYTDDEILLPDVATGEWRVSERFLEKCYDYRAWTMLPGFFELYPEMVHDIAMWEGEVVSRPIKPPKPGDLGHGHGDGGMVGGDAEANMSWHPVGSMNGSGPEMRHGSATMV